MRVLIIKTSSMGDVIHTLPALTDAKRARPNITFDWVVEEGFAEIPRWHPAVDEVIPVAIRRWRKQIIKTWGSNEWKQCKTHLRKHHYDLVIDAQGLLKSAWLTRWVKAPAAGYDKKSVREKVASWFYRHSFSVDKDMHAVERIRSLFAQALDYPKPETKGDYGIDRRRFCSATPEAPNVVFLHGTTRDDKHYPETYWRDLAKTLTGEGYRVRLPWGAAHERDRARRIAKGINGVEVLPRLSLHAVAGVLAQASAVVAVDTGLGHLTAALNIPAISLYGPTSPSLVGAYGENQLHLCAADYLENNAGAEIADVDPAVFAPLTPDHVYQQLQPMLSKKPVAC
jgi:heptosyltransferase-1